MATVTITIPNAIVPRLRNAFTAVYNYQATIGGNPNPETIDQFMQRKMREYMVEVVKTAEAPTAADTARATAITDVNTTVGGAIT